MPELSTTQIASLRNAANGLALSSAEQRFETFVATVLELNALQIAEYFPEPDLDARIEIAVAQVEKTRKEMLQKRSVIPNFVCYDRDDRFYISGLATRLLAEGSQPSLVSRLAQNASIRTYLTAIQDGHDLEAIAACILSSGFGNGIATQGSGDQGIDGISFKNWLQLEGDSLRRVFDEPHKIFAITSCKANLVQGVDGPETLSPMFIRDLIGGWIIQRSSISAWKEFQIKLLSPIQLLLVTTYVLSAESWNICNTLGIQVWTITDLIFLICITSPESVFSNNVFNPVEFEDWWAPSDQNRAERT